MQSRRSRPYFFITKDNLTDKKCIKSILTSFAHKQYGQKLSFLHESVVPEISQCAANWLTTSTAKRLHNRKNKRIEI